MSFTVKLKNRQEVAAGTMAFSFERPTGFTFEAGQAIDLTLVEPPETDAEGNTRAFTLASAPEERELLVATRMRDTAFKRVLKKLPLGASLELEGPFGNLVLPREASRPIVFLAGGIGITPFRSMLLHAARSKSTHRIYLFYSNRRPEDAAFLDELGAAERENPNYKLIATMTQMSKSSRPWPGETQPLSQPLLVRHLGTLDGRSYYVAGPPGLVAAMHRMLREAGVSEADIRREEFAGY